MQAREPCLCAIAQKTERSISFTCSSGRVVDGARPHPLAALRAISLVRRRRRAQFPVDASALDAAADGPLAAHPAQAILPVFCLMHVASSQLILFVPTDPDAEVAAPRLVQGSAGFPQAGGAILV